MFLLRGPKEPTPATTEVIAFPEAGEKWMGRASARDPCERVDEATPMGQGGDYVRRHAKASAARSHMTIGRAGIGLACLCLLAFAAIAGTGTAAAAECPNEAIRIAQGATRLPDCRAYERISPADGTGGLVGVDTRNLPMFAAIRADGEAAVFGSSSAVGETQRGATFDSNLARRTADGWTSFGVLNGTEPSVPWDLSMFAGWPTPSSDMTRELFVSSRSLGPPNSVTSGGSVYLSATDGKGVPAWLSRWSLPGAQPNPPSGSIIPLGGTPNLSSGYFTYPTPLTTMAGDQTRTVNWGLYFFEGSTIYPAGVLPSGTVDPQGALAAGTGQETIGTLAEKAGNQVSADGSKLFFVSPAEGSEPKQLYVEEGGKPSRLISHDVLGNAAMAGVSELNLGGASSAARVNFASATPDGSRVIFRSESALTADAPAGGIKTYRANITPGAIRLEYLSAIEGSPLAIDKSGSEILFSTPGSVSQTTSYYLWDEDRPAAPYLVAGDLASGGGPTMLEPTFSEDGDVLVFASGAEVEPGVVPRTEPSYTQIYRWTKAGGSPRCLSCLGGGTPARFGSRLSSFNDLPTDNPASPEGAAFEVFNQSTVVGNRKISDDGNRVFFDTSDPLDPARDVNGTRDVYMWENGKDYLLTSGRGTTPSYVFDSSESGNDVMLVTKDGLIPSDTNQTYDVYDVRVDGGFPEPVKEGCEGASCQSSGVAPAVSSPASQSVRGPGNQRQAAVGAVKVAQLGKPGKSARLRVEVPAAGRLKLSGKLLRSQSRSVKAKGTVKVTVTLTKAGKRKLAAKGSLTSKVTATFRDGEGRTKKSSVTLRFKQGAHR